VDRLRVDPGLYCELELSHPAGLSGRTDRVSYLLDDRGLGDVLGHLGSLPAGTSARLTYPPIQQRQIRLFWRNQLVGGRSTDMGESDSSPPGAA
jgi:hypothetical protein